MKELEIETQKLKKVGRQLSPLLVDSKKKKISLFS